MAYLAVDGAWRRLDAAPVVHSKAASAPRAFVAVQESARISILPADEADVLLLVVFFLVVIVLLLPLPLLCFLFSPPNGNTTFAIWFFARSNTTRW